MKIQSLFSLEIFRGGIFLKLLKKIYKLFFRIKISYFLLKNDPRGECLQKRSHAKKLSNTSLIQGHIFILLFKNMKFLVV